MDYIINFIPYQHNYLGKSIKWKKYVGLSEIYWSCLSDQYSFSNISFTILCVCMMIIYNYAGPNFIFCKYEYYYINLNKNKRYFRKT